jgi:BING4CT (NUC141) domain
MCYHDPEPTQCGHTSRPSEWYRNSVDPESPASGSAIIGASRTSFQCLHRPKHWWSLHGHCRRGRYREVMGLSQLEGCPTVLEQPWGSCYLSVESAGMPRRSIRRCSKRGYHLRLPVTCHYNPSYLAKVYSTPSVHSPNPAPSPPPLYLTHPQSAKPHTSLAFCPFQDILAIGHSSGVSCILVPGAGEPNFDSSEADPFEGSKARREREVKSLLDKVPFHAPSFTPPRSEVWQVVLIAVLDPTRHDRT